MKRATDIEFNGDVVSFGVRLSRLKWSDPTAEGMGYGRVVKKLDEDWEVIEVKGDKGKGFGVIGSDGDTLDGATVYSSIQEAESEWSKAGAGKSCRRARRRQRT